MRATTCTRCGASTKLTDRLAEKLGGKATCVACAGDCVVEDEAFERAKLMKGSDVPQPTGARCTRCAKVINSDGHGGFCSSDCSFAASAEVSDAKLRALVFERDNGICAECGEDCVAFRQHLNECMTTARAAGGSEARAWEARLLDLARRGYDRHAVESGAPLFEVDHVDPKARNGPSTLSNARTLCLPHHKAVSARFAGSRAAARKPKGRYGR